MQFPPTKQTARTEFFMAQWRKMNPEASTSEYNRKFSETYARFGSDPDAEEKDRELVAREDRRYAILEEDYREATRSPVLRPAKQRRVKVRRPVTKGAFGKSKLR